MASQNMTKTRLGALSCLKEPFLKKLLVFSVCVCLSSCLAGCREKGEGDEDWGKDEITGDGICASTTMRGFSVFVATFIFPVLVAFVVVMILRLWGQAGAGFPGGTTMDWVVMIKGVTVETFQASTSMWLAGWAGRCSNDFANFLAFTSCIWGFIALGSILVLRLSPGLEISSPNLKFVCDKLQERKHTVLFFNFGWDIYSVFVYFALENFSASMPLGLKLCDFTGNMFGLILDGVELGYEYGQNTPKQPSKMPTKPDPTKMGTPQQKV